MSRLIHERRRKHQPQAALMRINLEACQSQRHERLTLMVFIANGRRLGAEYSTATDDAAIKADARATAAALYPTTPPTYRYHFVWR